MLAADLNGTRAQRLRGIAAVSFLLSGAEGPEINSNFSLTFLAPSWAAQASFATDKIRLRRL
jgi:hypothetical protein